MIKFLVWVWLPRHLHPVECGRIGRYLRPRPPAVSVYPNHSVGGCGRVALRYRRTPARLLRLSDFPCELVRRVVLSTTICSVILNAVEVLPTTTETDAGGYTGRVRENRSARACRGLPRWTPGRPVATTARPMGDGRASPIHDDPLFDPPGRFTRDESRCGAFRPLRYGFRPCHRLRAVRHHRASRSR